jgi:hypothetical protein
MAHRPADDGRYVGIARYLATAATGDLDRTLWLADDLAAQPDDDKVALIECGRPSPLARELEALLKQAGRSHVSVLIQDRELAQSDALLRRLSGVGAVWIFAESLFEAYITVFATQLTFVLRRVAREGLPVVGVGPGAMALGGLVVAHRVCDSAQYDLVDGLGWAPRVLLDGGGGFGVVDAAITRNAVCTLPGLLAVELGQRGGVRVLGGRVESVGEEAVTLLGSDTSGRLLFLGLQPGQVTTIAPPPFAPFTRDLLPPQVREALSEIKPPVAVVRRASPQLVAVPSTAPAPPSRIEASKPGEGRLCPMCNRVHHTERVELAA